MRECKSAWSSMFVTQRICSEPNDHTRCEASMDGPSLALIVGEEMRIVRVPIPVHKDVCYSIRLARGDAPA